MCDINGLHASMVGRAGDLMVIFQIFVMFLSLKRCCLVLGMVSCFACLPQAQAAKADSIADFIKANRNDAGVVVNSPKYDQKAKVFFLFYLGYNAHQGDKMDSNSKPLVPVCKKLTGSGAELVMYLDFPPEQKDAAAAGKKGKARRGASAERRTLAVKCPVVNIFHKEARDVLFKKDARGKEQSYGTYELRATDANGVPLGYFSYENGEMVMRDAETGEKKTIGKGSYTGNAWVGPAILASYEELVARVSPEKVAAESSEAGEDTVPKSKKKSKKKSSRKRKSKD